MDQEKLWTVKAIFYTSCFASCSFSESVQEDYDDTIQGKETRYGKITSPEEQAQVRKRKRRALAEYFVSDGQPPDTSKDLPLDNDFNDV